jgi:uncharacterized membrane protein YfcA
LLSGGLVDPILEALGVTPIGFVAIFAAVFVGALVQGSIGFGLNLIAVPAIAVYQPAVLPAAAIILALPMTLGSALRERTHIDPPAVLWVTLGRLPGVILGAWVVSRLAPESLSLVIGGIVVVAVIMSVTSISISIDRRSQAVVGFLGGLMGTTSSVGGPPMALLYQNEPGPTVRATLGATFLVGLVLSLVALGVVGEVSTLHWRFGGAMMPAVLLGLFVSRFAHAWLDAGWLRPCVLGFSALAGIGVVIRGLGSL